MSDPPTACLTVIANPDVSGIGVRTAIYVQNLLSFIPVLWALRDGRITPTELDELEKQSTTILIMAFAILISTVIQAYHHGISNYHASIVLDLSWMNNTNLFIYFLLYVYYRVHLSEDEFDEEVRVFPGRARLEYRADSLARWIYETKKASKNSVIIIGSLHLSLMAAVGIWLWSHPAGLGTLAVIDIVLLVDTEVTIKDNTNRFHLSGEAEWTFGQTLALLLLLVALRDLGESILHKRAKWLSNQLLEASKNGEIEAAKALLRQEANPK
ncbi:hypothetical protein C0993_007857 [Termitomyces sp. T159_Od127]|nr:hypothetical protein C0993_007857 [Termitomyces sp. T159_Od127]